MQAALGLTAFLGTAQADHLRAYLGPNCYPLGDSWPMASLTGFYKIQPVITQWTLCVVTASVCGDPWVPRI